MIYTYKFTVSFHKGECPVSIGKREITYMVHPVTKKDRVSFYKKKFVLEAERTKKYNAQDILISPSLSVHQEVETCIMLYYANSSNFPLINKILVEVIYRGNVIDSYTPLKSAIPQFVSETTMRDSRLRFSPTDVFFDMSPKGKALRISVSYWLEAINVDIKQIRFERAWTAFNTLYTFYGKYSTEFQNHAYIKDEIRTHLASFPLTLADASIVHDVVLRNYRWGLWLKNMISRDKHNVIETLLLGLGDDRLKNLFSSIWNSGFVIAGFSDSRDRIKDTTLRTKYINIKNALAIVGRTDDMELALMLCINYAYYLRNQRFHGGTINSRCKICTTNEEQEYEKLASRLSLLVKEMYEAHAIIQERVIP